MDRPAVDCASGRCLADLLSGIGQDCIDRAQRIPVLCAMFRAPIPACRFCERTFWTVSSGSCSLPSILPLARATLSRATSAALVCLSLSYGEFQLVEWVLFSVCESRFLPTQSVNRGDWTNLIANAIVRSLTRHWTTSVKATR